MATKPKARPSAASSALKTLVADSGGVSSPAVPAVAPLDFSAREILKGTLVPVKGAAASEAHGLAKYGAARQLALAPGETDAVADHMRVSARLANRQEARLPVAASTLDVFRALENPLIPALRPGVAAVAAVPTAELALFASAVAEMRAAALRTAQENRAPTQAVASMIQSLNAAVVAARSLQTNTAIQPLGMLNLERIEMAPAGIQRGELVTTIPLAPGEETAVTHKEWSVTSKEFTTIVTDSLEQTSETGVTDNTDLSQSTTSQNQHSTQFNITATVQGGIPIISGSSTAGMTAQDGGSLSATESTKHATSLTNKASARSRVEHKTTISTTTVTGSAETSTRILKNTSTTDPIRIDYFSLMRKWRVRLYRFGLRLTYDLVMPEPGATMRRAYAELDTLRSQIGPFVFNIKHTELTNDPVDKDTGLPLSKGDTTTPTIPRYQWYADQNGASLPLYPATPKPMTPGVSNFDGSIDWLPFVLEFDVPDGSMIKQIFLDLNVSYKAGGGGMVFQMMGTQFWPVQLTDVGSKIIVQKHTLLVDAPGSVAPFLEGRTGHQKLYCVVHDGFNIVVQLTVELDNLPDVIEKWRADAWNALYSAAQVNYFAQQQDISARIAALEDNLANVDTLTLRREESDEVMKNVLKFVLGTKFDFMPTAVQAAFVLARTDIAHGIGFDGETLGSLDARHWSVLGQHEEIVRFINQAIEWENVVTFLYSYFWDVPESWNFIRQLRHPDATRQAFLRAGSARVVLTVRKGWEAKWVRFAQDGTVDADIAPGSTDPYLSIGQEIAAYDDRNYPGIPPANPARDAVRLQDAVYTTASVKIDPSASPVAIAVGSSAGIVAGLPVVLDVEDDRHIQEETLVTNVPDATHIVVVSVVHAHDGTQVPVPVLQPGTKGAMIAEWFEYTPSSGIDIAVTSNLETIA
jgi:hypothetical protein